MEIRNRTPLPAALNIVLDKRAAEHLVLCAKATWNISKSGRLTLADEPKEILVADECVGKPGMIAMAIDKVRLGGSVLSLGMCSMPETFVPAMNTFKEVSLHFPLAYSIKDFTETIRMFDAGKVRPEAMVSATIGLDELPAMIEEMRGPHEHLKVQVAPNQ